MATQLITLAKIGGASADVVLGWFREWSEAQVPRNPNSCSPEQWPPELRIKADDFAERLRAHACVPPVVYYVEWVDLWSMWGLFSLWLSPSDGPPAYLMSGNKYELFAYGLPDSGRLAKFLDVDPEQWPPTDRLISRLREAVAAWDTLVDRAAIVVLRQVVGGSILNEEITASLAHVAAWL